MLYTLSIKLEYHDSDCVISTSVQMSHHIPNILGSTLKCTCIKYL